MHGTLRHIFLIGAGSWGTALAKIIQATPDRHLSWYMRQEESARQIALTGKNPNYLSDITLDIKRLDTLSGTPGIPSDVDAVVLALPAAFSGEVLQKLNIADFDGPVISAAKGLIPDLHLTVTEWMEQHSLTAPDKLYMLGGPCHSEEVALEKRSYLTLGGNAVLPDEPLSGIFRSESVTCSASADLRGIEFAAVLKNVMALACGIALGTHRGDNFLAVLVSAAARETERFLDTHFPLPGRNINESAYLGDLLVTCFSPHSRNRTFGLLVGRGYSPSAAKTEMAMVAEGYYAVKGLAARFDITDFPIIETVYACLHQGKPAKTAIKELETRLR